jgi:outer membrane protein assembly factor BamD
MRKSLTCIFLLSLVLLSACSSSTAVPPQKSAGAYFQEGEESFEKGKYRDAIASWEKVRDSYFSPELNTLAELKIAEAHFLNEDYIESAVAYEAFLTNHPNSPRIPDVLYQLGVSYMYQILSDDQDQTATTYSLKAFQTLKERFPRDRRMQEVQLYIDRCFNQLAASELNIGVFYLRTEYFAASIYRIEGLLKKYPNFYQLDKAYYYLGMAYLLSGERDKAGVAFNTLFNDYAGSEYIADAREFIEDNY